MKKDEYKSPKSPSEEVLFKDKGSKFFGYVFTVKDENEIENALEKLKAKQDQAKSLWDF